MRTLARRHVFASAVVAGAAALLYFAASSPQAQPAAATAYVPIGVSQLSSSQSAAWVLDARSNRITVCVVSTPGPGPRCDSATLP